MEDIGPNANEAPQMPTEPQSPEIKKEQEKTASRGIIGILIFAVLLLTTSTAYLAWQNIQLQKQISQLPTEQDVSTPTPTRDSTAGWETYKNTEFGFQFDHPLNGSFSLVKNQGETGIQICIQHSDNSSGLIKTVLAGGGACSDDTFAIGLLSSDFIAGRSADFSDNLGYLLQGGKMLYVPYYKDPFELPTNLITLTTNQKGVQVLKVLGETIQENSPFPTRGTPGQGYVGAIINTGNSNYPSISLIANLEKVDEKTFDQILSTFEFTK